MAFLTSIVEWEGAVVNVRARYWAAHREAMSAIGYEGPPEGDFWRLVRTGASDGQLAPHAKTPEVIRYAELRDERIASTELMALDEALPGAPENLRVLEQMGTCHLATLCPNREGINATLDRLDLWIHFDRKEVLPGDGDRRVARLKEMAGAERAVLAVAGTIPFAYAAGEAGHRVVGMKTGLAFPKQMRQVGVDVCYDSLDALTEGLIQRDPQLQRIGLF